MKINSPFKAVDKKTGMNCQLASGESRMVDMSRHEVIRTDMPPHLFGNSEHEDAKDRPSSTAKTFAIGSPIPLQLWRDYWKLFTGAAILPVSWEGDTWLFLKSRSMLTRCIQSKVSADPLVALSLSSLLLSPSLIPGPLLVQQWLFKSHSSLQGSYLFYLIWGKLLYIL